MKKIFLFLAVASMTAFTSCSSDDSNGTPNDPNAATGVVLASNLDNITLGESVALTVTDNNANIVTTASKILVNNVEIAGATFTPDATGVFTIKATYKNTNNVTLESNELTITVAPASPYKLSYNGTNIAVTAGDMIYWGAYYTDETQTSVVEIFALATHDGDLSAGSPANLTFVDFTTPYNEAEMALPTAGSYDWVAPFTALRELQLKVDGTVIPTANFASVAVNISEIEFAAGGVVTMAYSTNAAFGGTSTSKSSGSGSGFLYDASGKAAAKGNNIEVFSAAKLNAKKAAFVASTVKMIKK